MSVKPPNKVDTPQSEKKIRFYERMIIAVLKKGHIPRHIGFIMDGNRRYAVSKGQSKIEGHS